MKNLPLVSVVTPCYNGALYLKDYFNSLLSQSYDNFEVVFVNDGSIDNTEEIALNYKEKFLRKKINFIYLYQENAGQANALNNGLKYVNGKYLIWPDSDDILHEDSIRLRVEFLEKNPTYDVVRSNGYIFDDKSKRKICRLSNSDNRFHKDIFLDLIKEETFCNCVYMISVDLFRHIYINMQIPESPAGQNWQILIPVCGNSKCGFIDKDLYFIREHEDSHSRQKRSVSEQIKRFEDLKSILLLSIKVSQRTDRDYEHIVDVKYYKIYFLYFLSIKDECNCRKYFVLLKDNVLEDDNINVDDLYMHYLKTFKPFKFKVKGIFASVLKRFI
jgi:glycosyltransferase involved in cell wall biosynthesis